MMSHNEAIKDAEYLQSTIELLDLAWRSRYGELDETNKFEWCVKFAKRVLFDVHWETRAKACARSYTPAWRLALFPSEVGDFFRSPQGIAWLRDSLLRASVSFAASESAREAGIRALAEVLAYPERTQQERSRLASLFAEFVASGGRQGEGSVGDRSQEDLRTRLRGWMIRLVHTSTEERWAWDALSLIARELIREGIPLPPELAQWVGDVLADQSVKKKELQRRPQPNAGRPTNHEQDRHICAIVRHLQRWYGLTPTRNEASEARSGCDAVAEALGKPYKTIEGIWNRRKPFLDSLPSLLNS